MIANLKADEILGRDIPELLFTGRVDTAKKEYREFAKLWHPDKSSDPKADAVFAHVTKLYNVALDKIGTGVWEVPGLIQLKGAGLNGKQFNIKYKKHHSFEMGDMYIGNKIVAYIVKPEFEKFYQNAKRRTEGLKFASENMRFEMEKCMPKIVRAFKANDGRLGFVIEKDEDAILLRDIIQHQGGKIDPRHVAWIMSTMYNNACYLNYSGLVHSGISTDSYFISPKEHWGFLLGNWWYTTPVGEQLKSVPKFTYDVIPSKVLKEKTAIHKIDTELIKAVGREMLGDKTGVRLVKDKNVPDALRNWVCCAGGTNALEDYKKWDSVLKESFGARRFVKLDIKPTDVYGKE